MQKTDPTEEACREWLMLHPIPLSEDLAAFVREREQAAKNDYLVSEIFGALEKAKAEGFRAGRDAAASLADEAVRAFPSPHDHEPPCSECLPSAIRALEPPK